MIAETLRRSRWLPRPRCHVRDKELHGAAAQGAASQRQGLVWLRLRELSTHRPPRGAA